MRPKKESPPAEAPAAAPAPAAPAAAPTPAAPAAAPTPDAAPAAQAPAVPHPNPTRTGAPDAAPDAAPVTAPAGVATPATPAQARTGTPVTAPTGAPTPVRTPAPATPAASPTAPPTAAPAEKVGEKAGEKPAEEATEDKKRSSRWRKDRVRFPGLKPDDKGRPTAKLKEMPKDLDLKKYYPLKRGDFEDETIWLLDRAETFDAKAVSYREEADDWKRLGSIKDRVKAKKLITMQRRMADLKTQLQAQGIDVDALLGVTDDDDEDDDED